MKDDADRQGPARDPDARRTRRRQVAELRHRPEAAARRGHPEQPGDDERPSGPARALLRGAPRLLEGRHDFGPRLRRRHHPAVLGSGRQVSGLERIPHPARHAAGGLPLHHRPAAQDGRHLGRARLGPDRLPRPVGRHHVPGLLVGSRAAGVRRAQRARLRPRRRRPGAADRDVLRRPRPLRAVVLRRGARPPHA